MKGANRRDLSLQLQLAVYQSHKVSQAAILNGSYFVPNGQIRYFLAILPPFGTM
jgi:hypothetical protein